MNDSEVRSILPLHRPGELAFDEARLQEALQKAETEPALKQWWNAEQELERVIAAKLANTTVPVDLKKRMPSERSPSTVPHRSSWRRALLATAATIIVLGVLFSSWRGPFQPAVSLADYRGEMINCIRVSPSLEFESGDLAHLQGYLAKAGAPAQFAVPRNLQGYEPVGCRVLRFHGHDVSLVCFKIGGARLAHLFVADARSVPTVESTVTPLLAAEKDRMTATWKDGGQVYLLVVRGDRPEIEKFIENS